MGQRLSKSWNESYFIPKPTLTEKNLPDQLGRVHIVTGGYVGIGEELTRILYEKNATIYIAGRSKDKADKAIATLKEKHPESKGKLEFLLLDLSDFKTLKLAADEFLSKETRLDVLTNNAGIMMTPAGGLDAQGGDLQMGTNCLGPFIFTQLLMPILLKTAKTAPANSVRITWAASATASFSAPKDGVTFEGDDVKVFDSPAFDYSQSKAGNILLGAEFAERYGKDGIISVSFNPGNLKTDLIRHMPFYLRWFLLAFLLYPSVYGAYTELWAGWSEDLNQSNNGAYISPWGRVNDPRDDLVASMKRIDDGGSGVAEKFYNWCGAKTKEYL